HVVRARPDLHSFPTRRSSDLLPALVERGGSNPGPEGNRPHSRHVLREYGQSIGEGGALKVAAYESTGGHRRDRSPRGRLRGRSLDRKSTRLNSSHVAISYAVF